MQNYRLGLCGFVLLAAGCSQGPARIAAPNVDPDATAERAIELYDTDHDAVLSKKELAACPGILNNLPAYDQNGDNLVARDEIVGRLSDLFGKRIGLTEVISQVTYQGRPLPDAIVVFEPEPYLGPEIPPAQGATGSDGSAPMAIAAEYLPENLRQRNKKLTRCGTFKVRITHPTIKLPPKYNTQTTLGYETQLGTPFASFALTAK